MDISPATLPHLPTDNLDFNNDLARAQNMPFLGPLPSRPRIRESDIVAAHIIPTPQSFAVLFDKASVNIDELHSLSSFNDMNDTKDSYTNLVYNLNAAHRIRFDDLPAHETVENLKTLLNGGLDLIKSIVTRST